MRPKWIRIGPKNSSHEILVHLFLYVHFHEPSSGSQFIHESFIVNKRERETQ